MTFGEYLKLQREKFGWNQPEASKKIHIEQSYLSKLETGKSYPSEQIFNQIVRAYDIDVEMLNKHIDTAEYEKLKEIKQIRKLVIAQKKSDISSYRGWLISGLVFLMISGACLAITHIYGSAETQFYYRSQGVLKAGEPLQAFSIIDEIIKVEDQAKANKKQQYIDRIDQHDVIADDYKGKSYVENVPQGKRYYELYSQHEVSNNGGMSWLLVPGVMFLFGGIACFFISWRWK